MRRMIWAIAAVSWLLVPLLCAPSVAEAQTTWRDDSGTFDAEVRSLFGRQGTHGARVHSLSFGLTVLGSPSFQYSARLAAFTGSQTSAHQEEGLRPSLDVADLGIGGEFGLRIVPWPALPVRPTLAVTSGVFGLPLNEFLPGGAHYVFQHSASLGLEFTVATDHDLRLEVVTSHFSNGQGLNNGNPALDSFGVAFGWAPMRTVTVPESPYPETPPRPLVGEPRLLFGLSTALADDLLLTTASGAVAFGITPHTTVQFDAEGGSLGTRAWGETGVAVRGKSRGVHGILRVGYRRYARINVWPLLAQLELELTRDLSLVGAGVYDRSMFDGAKRVAGGLRVWPLSWLGLEGGWAANGTSGATDHTGWLVMEAMVPWTNTRSRLSLYAGRQPSTWFEVGLRLGSSAGGDLRGRDRDLVIRGLR